MSILGVFQQLGTGEILLILFIVLLLFGAKRLPDMGKSLGKGLREFRDATKGLADDVKDGLEDDKKPQHSADKPADRSDI
ncbi:MAG TPA: twin-arginine translocase TatA/TatE family subunit [Actinomycetota bacterium]|nr:twin-arginine translocase TatA/TatE family subunit [Actinomycetota bacterium]